VDVTVAVMVAVRVGVAVCDTGVAEGAVVADRVGDGDDE